MARGKTAFGVAVAALVFPALMGCGPQITPQQYIAQMNASDAARQASRVPAQKAELQAVRDGKLPKNYKKQIDDKFVDILIDPDSRKVAFGANPYGGLSCGTVNAKNKMGGYTGKDAFYAIFDGSGVLKDLQMFSAGDIGNAKSMGAPGDYSHVPYILLLDCGAAS